MINKSGGKATSMPVGIIWGGLTCMILTLLQSAFVAWLVITQKIDQNQIGYGIMIVLVLSACFGAKVSFWKIKRQRLLVSAVSGLVYFGLLMSVTALFFGGQYSGVGETALMILCGAGLAFLLKRGPQKGHNKRKIKNAYR